MVTSAEPSLPVSIAASLRRALSSSTAGLSGSAGSTSKTPIHDTLLFSHEEWPYNEWINPFRTMVWDGKKLVWGEIVVQDEDAHPPWSKHL